MIDNLHHHKVYVIEWCYTWKKAREMADHLFLHCNYARELWHLVLCLFKVHWVMPQQVLDVLACWKGRFVRQSICDVWCTVPLCITMTVWKEYDWRAFEGLERLSTKLKLFLLSDLHEWIAALPIHSSSNLLDFIDSCTFSWWVCSHSKLQVYWEVFCVLCGSFFNTISIIH